MSERVKTDANGIFIDDYIRMRMNDMRTNGGSADEYTVTFRKMEELTGVPFAKWNHIENGKETYVRWETWELIYKALVTGIYDQGPAIDPNDIEYMPPSVLRDRLKNGQTVNKLEKTEPTKEEKEILYLFGLLNETGKQTALATMKALASTSPLVDSQLVKKHTA